MASPVPAQVLPPLTRAMARVAVVFVNWRAQAAVVALDGPLAVGDVDAVPPTELGAKAASHGTLGPGSPGCPLSLWNKVVLW